MSKQLNGGNNSGGSVKWQSGKGQVQNAPLAPKRWSQMDAKEKVRACCVDFNKKDGCSRVGCKYTHVCSHLDKSNNWLCGKSDHGLANHK